MDEYVKNRQKEYLQNEIWKLTFGAAFQRANVYKSDTKEYDRKQFKRELREEYEAQNSLVVNEQTLTPSLKT